ncbi:MAG: hypothetical protein ABI537_03880 [Casimicrobiaceae bacterium]
MTSLPLAGGVSETLVQYGHLHPCRFPTRSGRKTPAAARISRTLLVLVASGAILASSAMANPFQCPNAWPLRRAFLAFDSPTTQYSDQLLDYIASHFEFADATNPLNLNELKRRNPNFYMVAHNSLSDNFVPPAPPSATQEHDWLQAHAAEFGVDPEDVYLHFWNDTEVSLEGQNIVVPGWQPGSPKAGATAATRFASRVPVYYRNLTRRITNLSTPQLRAANRAYNLMLVEQPISASNYWEGWFFDNSGDHRLIVTVVTNGAYASGGQIAEHPAHTVINSPAFIDWYWYQGIGLFMKELREWVLEHPDAHGGRRLRIVPNVFNLPYLDTDDWDRAYIDLHPADTLFQELEMNPTRDALGNFPAIIHQKNKLAQIHGVDLFQPGWSVTAQPPAIGTFTRDEALLNSLSLHWVTRTPNVLTLGDSVYSVQVADWLQNMRGVFDVDLGAPSGAPYVLASGTDSHFPAYPYSVYARDFACGFAIVRERGGSDQDFDPTTGVNVQLPGTYTPIDADGNMLPATNRWTLRNGQGQMFVSAPPNFQGLWWHSPAGSESGWGINLAHQGDVIFATWFTYDMTGTQWWLSMTATKQSNQTYSGTLYESGGPAFDAAPFSPSQVIATAVGTGTLAFADRDNAAFAYTLSGVAQSKTLVRQTFGPQPTCVFGVQPNLALATNYQDLWWAAPAGSEAGWGVNVTHQGDTLFATWFTYGHDGKPLWLSATAVKSAFGGFAGNLYRTTGPAFDVTPFDSSRVLRAAVGTARFTFTDGNSGIFAYTVDGVARAKAITRQVFRSPGTVCR